MKIKISVWETVRFEHELTIEMPDEIDVDSVLDECENVDFFDDIPGILEEHGCKILEILRDDGGSDISLEIPDYTETKNGKADIFEGQEDWA